ncbi:MAG TPA: hypothetical protein VNS62_05995 [Candidatus Udaeobacter sp.]|nr:hypothetical protein [Candidatus Udaeobacter sp.]
MTHKTVAAANPVGVPRPDPARELLQELCASKDLHDFLESDLLPEYRAQHAAELADMEAEYRRRKSAAWQAARAYLANPVQPTLATPLSGLIEELQRTHDEIVEMDYGKESGVTLLLQRAATALADAYRQGAEAMREAAAKACDEYPRRDPAEDGSGYWAAAECAEQIRALPLEPPK